MYSTTVRRGKACFREKWSRSLADCALGVGGGGIG